MAATPSSSARPEVVGHNCPYSLDVYIAEIGGNWPLISWKTAGVQHCTEPFASHAICVL